MSMVTLRAGAKFGFGGKQYIARITGRDSKYTFSREFVGRKEGKRGKDSTFETDEIGLYLCCDIDRKGNKEERFRLVLADGDTLKIVRAEKEEALAIAKAIDEGRSLDQIIANVDFDEHSFDILSASAAKKQQAGATVDSAVEHCWSVLQSLPTKEAKKVLAALKLKVNPPAPAPEPVAPAAEGESAVEDEPKPEPVPTIDEEREEGDPDRVVAG